MGTRCVLWKGCFKDSLLNDIMAELRASLNVKFVELYLTCKNMFIHSNQYFFIVIHDKLI